MDEKQHRHKQFRQIKHMIGDFGNNVGVAKVTCLIYIRHTHGRRRATA